MNLFLKSSAVGKRQKSTASEIFLLAPMSTLNWSNDDEAAGNDYQNENEYQQVEQCLVFSVCVSA